MSIEIQTTIKNLHPLEVRILLTYKKGDELTIESVEKDLGFKPGNGNQALSWLASKGLVSEVRREPAVFYELTILGEEWKEKGSPEERILELIRKRLEKLDSGQSPLGGLPDLAQALNMENKDIGSAFGSLSKNGVLKMDGSKNVTLTIPLEHLQDPAKNPVLARFRIIRGLMEKVIKSEGGLVPESTLSGEEKSVISAIAKKRGASDAPFRQIDRETVVFTFTVAKDGSVPAEAAAAELRAAGITGDETGTLTPEMLES